MCLPIYLSIAVDLSTYLSSDVVIYITLRACSDSMKLLPRIHLCLKQLLVLINAQNTRISSQAVKHSVS